MLCRVTNTLDTHVGGNPITVMKTQDRATSNTVMPRASKTQDRSHARAGRAMTELEKIQHLTQKYRLSKRLYTVYSRSGDEGRYVFTLIYGTDNKHKAIAYVQVKEAQGLFLVAYCARPRERSSRCVYVSGMQNALNGHGASSAAPALGGVGVLEGGV